MAASLATNFVVSMDTKGPYTETFSNKKVVECQEKKHQNIEVKHKKINVLFQLKG